jgi:hypothetical protein
MMALRRLAAASLPAGSQPGGGGPSLRFGSASCSKTFHICHVRNFGFLRQEPHKASPWAASKARKHVAWASLALDGHGAIQVKSRMIYVLEPLEARLGARSHHTHAGERVSGLARRQRKRVCISHRGETPVRDRKHCHRSSVRARRLLVS